VGDFEAMNIDSIRAYCLSFPGATEGLQWGDDLLFRVGNKIFVSVSLGSVPVCMTVKSTPERCAELLETEGITRAAYVGRYDFITLERLDLLPDAQMKELIAESYENVRRKLPQAVRAALEEKQSRSAGPARRNRERAEKKLRRKSA